MVVVRFPVSKTLRKGMQPISHQVPPIWVSKLVQVHAIGSEITVISEWIRGGFKGYNVRIYVRAADAWNIRLSYVLPIQNM